MSNTPIYNKPHLTSNPVSPQVPINDEFDTIENAANAVFNWTITGDTTVAQTDLASGLVHKLGGTPGSDFAFNLPSGIARHFWVYNNSGKTATIQVTGGAGLKVLAYTGEKVQVHTDGTDVTIWNPSNLAGWQTVQKLADETKTANTTFANDAELKFSMLVNKKYRIRGTIWFDTTAAGDFKYQFVGPASPTLVRFERIDCVAGGTPAENVPDTAYPTNKALAGAGTTGGYIRFEAIVQNGASAGTFALQWAQNTSDAGNTTVYAGSYIEYGAH